MHNYRTKYYILLLHSLLGSALRGVREEKGATTVWRAHSRPEHTRTDNTRLVYREDREFLGFISFLPRLATLFLHLGLVA